MSDDHVPGDEGVPSLAGIGDPVEMAKEDENFLGTPWSRRTFLKAAALGTAAAAVFQKGPGLSLNPSVAHAQLGDLSSLNCTANDVRIVGPGVILNEPCSCTGNFNADVSFHIVNNTGTDRYCVTVHLCAGVDANGTVIVPAQDIVVGTIPANFDGQKTVRISNYPCNSGLVCFGVAGSGTDGGFAKGESCPSGKCCSTISWNVKASDPCPDTTRQISSKCRHQQVCIVGRSVTLDCDTQTTGTQTSCAVTCGASGSLRLCVTGGQSPYVFNLYEADGTTLIERYPASGTTTDTCHTFTTAAITANTTFVGKVTDHAGCTKQASATLTTSATAATPSVTAGADTCGGVLTIDAGAGDCTDITWNVSGYGDIDPTSPIDDGTASITDNGDGTLTYRVLDGGCHTITATPNCANSCASAGSIKVCQSVGTTVDCTADCCTEPA